MDTNYTNPILVLLLYLSVLPGSAVNICMDKECHFELTLRWAQTMSTKIDPHGHYYRVGQDTHDDLRVISYPTGFVDGSPAMGSKMSADHVITGDGHLRDVITINGEFPGPAIHVTEGAWVNVRVLNELDTSVTIHWHGIYQRGTPWMDGVGMLTQCPIHGKQSFTYRFVATPSGTHWYHAHTHSHRLDGLYGLFVVHKHYQDVSPPPVEHLLAVQDWERDADSSRKVSIEQRGTDEMIRHQGHMINPIKGTLVNGRGRSPVGARLPLTTYNVTSGDDFRFRVVNAGAAHAYRMSVDEHVITVVATDGYSVKPVKVQSAYILPGETLDVVVSADQPAGNYWIRLKAEMLHFNTMHAHHSANDEDTATGAMNNGMSHDAMNNGMSHDAMNNGMNHSEMNKSINMSDKTFESGWAILSYLPTSNPSEKSSEHHPSTNISSHASMDYTTSIDDDPKSLDTNCTEDVPCRVFNCPSAAPLHELGVHCISIDRLRADDELKDSLEADFGVAANEPVEEFFLNFAFSVGTYKGSSVNSRRFVHPSAPLYQSYDNNDNDSSIVSCKEEDCVNGCECTHILQLPAHKTIQLVLTNFLSVGSVFSTSPVYPNPPSAHHPVHIHGHGFAVLKLQEFKGHNSPDVDCMDPFCSRMRWSRAPDLNLEAPPVKDTVVVPVHGYVVIRFRTDNPGFWFMHCHQQQHLVDGMALVLQEGDITEFPVLPHDFPACSAHYDINVKKTHNQYKQTDAAKHLHLSTGEAVGAAFGFILCGAILAAIGILIYVIRHIRSGKIPSGNQQSFAQENIAFN